jgi:DNA-binding beta-propeller fold protein YncE
MVTAVALGRPGVGVRTAIRISLGTLVALVALAPAMADAASPRPGVQYFGVTSQAGNVVAQVSGDGRRIAWFDVQLRARCVGRRLAVQVKHEEVSVRRLTIGPGARFGRSGRIVGYDSGPGGIGERFPVVVSGRLAGRFTTSRRLEGTARLTLRGRFYLGGGSGEGFYGERATCRTGPIRFWAEVPRESRSRLGALRELRRPSGCLFSRRRAGCRRVSGLGSPENILLSADGRNAYVVTSSPDERTWLLGFDRDRRTGTLTRIAGAGGCIRADGVSRCATLRGPDEISGAAISPDGRTLYLVDWEIPAIATVRRNPSTGVLTQLPRQAGCQGPAAEACGPLPPVDSLGSPRVSPDGRHVYFSWYRTEGAVDQGVMWLRRNRDSGVLGATATPGCIGARGSLPCRTTPVTGDVVLLELSRDGRHVYAGLSGSPLMAFARTRSSGALEPLPEPETCHFARRRRGCRARDASPTALAISPDGRTLYYAFDAAIAALARRSDGGLDQLEGQWACVGSELTSGCRPTRGLELLNSLAVSPDGRNLYTGDYGDGLMATFERRRNGRLLQLSGGAGCFVGLHGAPAPLYQPWGCIRTRLADEVSAIAPSADGRHVYVASGVWPDFGGLHVFTRRRR